MDTPKISVLLPTYNAEKYLFEAIDSILKQTFTDFEFLIINDGSTDKSEEIILSFSDKRIRYYKNETNLGLVKTLNKGLELSRGKYIVRMDSDDISIPNRLEIQYDFMEKNLDIGVCGSNIQCINERGKLLGDTKYPEKDSEIKSMLITGNPMAHPTTIIRKSILLEHNLKYSDNYYRIEDYKLWVDLFYKTNFHNIQQELLYYRLYPKYIPNSQYIHEKMILLLMETLEIFLGRNLTQEEKELYYNLHYSLPFHDLKKITKIKNWAENITSHQSKTIINIDNAKLSEYFDHLIDALPKKMFYGRIKKRSYFSISDIFQLFLFNNSLLKYFGKVELIKIIIKCIIFYKYPKKT